MRWALEIVARSVDTNDIDRDNVIRSMDFIDVECHPLVRFLGNDITPTETVATRSRVCSP